MMKHSPAQASFEKVVFVDRDGVLNHEPGPVLTPEQFRWILRSPEAISLINQQGWLCLVITNQSAFAKGTLTQENFAAICETMNQGLAQANARIDDLFCCPHYPTWKEGWIQELCYPCDCRKPKTGLLKQAAIRWNLSGKKAVLIGDNTKDFEAAFRWGIPSIGVKTGHAGRDGTCDRNPSVWADDLFDAIALLLDHWLEVS